MGKARKAGRKKSSLKKATMAAAISNRNAKVSLAPEPWDHGADGQANRKGLVKEQRGDIDPETGNVINPNSVTGVRRVDILKYWADRGTISPAGYNAALALRNAYESTQKTGRPALPENDRVQSSSKSGISSTIMIDRISRYSFLMGHVQKEDRDIVKCCVLDGWHPSRIYGALRTKDGLKHLYDALERMAFSLEQFRKPVYTE